MKVPIFVHHNDDKPDKYFDFHAQQENSGNELWNILVIKTEEGWAVCDNIGPSDSMSIYCAPKPSKCRMLLNHYFPGRSTLNVYDVLQTSPHDPEGILNSLLLVYCRVFRQPWPKRNILNIESNVTTLKLLLRTCVKGKSLDRFPSWVLRGPLDNGSIITPTVH